VDKVINQAVAAGAELTMTPQDLPSDGDRRGSIKDPFGITWFIATQIREVTREELQRAYDEQK
jgi:PhnB protein